MNVNDRLYSVRRERARKLWHASSWRWPPPRLVQLGWIVHCSVFGHDWSLWAIDDIDGPGEHFDDGGFMPYLSRPSRPGEFGTRSCRDCRAVETRWPLREMPPLFAGRMRVGER